MAPTSEEYSLLTSSEKDSEDLSQQEIVYRSRFNSHITVVYVLLLLSVISNLLLGLKAYYPSFKYSPAPSGSKYANLVVDQSKPFVAYTDYSSSNFTLADQLWDAIDFDDGLVALPNEWTASKGLPESARFPWDQSRSIWLLNGYHGLHCVKRIYISLMEYRKGLPQSLPTTHITHCLDSLRDQIICDADDTPRFTRYRTDDGHITGYNQKRQCRGWESLEMWAKKHNACYRYGDPTWDKESQYERFKFCPNDSPYLPVVKEFFGKDDDWNPMES